MEMEVMKLVKAIKKAMIDKGRDDFGKYLAEILDISPQAAGRKLSGKSHIKWEELKKIVAELDPEAEELKGALFQ